MNFLTAATRLRKGVEKRMASFENWAETIRRAGGDPGPSPDYAILKERAIAQLRLDMADGITYMNMYKELLAANKVDAWYLVTVRGPQKAVDGYVDTLYAAAAKWTRRKPVGQFFLAFEQTGKCAEDLGDGAHVHICCEVDARSIAEVRRFAFSTFEHCVADRAFIDVKKAPRPEGVRAYLDHISDDGHKEELAPWDAQWRAAHRLADLYEAALPEPRV